MKPYEQFARIDDGMEEIENTHDDQGECGTVKVVEEVLRMVHHKDNDAQDESDDGTDTLYRRVQWNTDEFPSRKVVHYKAEQDGHNKSEHHGQDKMEIGFADFHALSWYK